MDVFIIGGTGYIGTHVVRALVARGDAVRALARSDASAATAEALGATVVRGELSDAATLGEEAGRAAAVINLAVLESDDPAAAAEALGVADRYVHTGGIWSFGNTHGGADETQPLHPPTMTRWRTAIEESVLAAGGVVVMPGVVYGEGAGLLPDVFGEGRFVGNGEYHVAIVHVEDAAQAYLTALDAPAGTRLVPVTQCLEARAIAGAFASPKSESLADAQARLGEQLAEAMTLDQRITAVRLRELGWAPCHRDALAELSA